MTTDSKPSDKTLEIEASARKAVHEMLVRKAKLGEYVVVADKNKNPIRIKAEDALKLAEKEAKYDAARHPTPPQSNG